MPFDPEDTFIPADPAQWPRVGGVPRIVVHPNAPPNATSGNTAGDDEIDDWFVPEDDGFPNDWFVPEDDGFPNDWFVPDNHNAPALPAPPSTAPWAPSSQPNPAASTRPPARLDPYEAFWSQIPASRAGAMAWAPPIFLSPDSFAPQHIPAWGTPPKFANPLAQFLPATSALPWAGLPNIPTTGGILGGLARLGSPGPAIPLGGMFDGLAQLGSSTPNSRNAFPPPPQPQFANAPAGSPVGRRPLVDYSTGEILGDAVKSFGVGVGQTGIQGAGFLGDARETIANGVQRAADYLAPGSAPNAGSKVSDFLASYPLLAGPTSSQLQRAVESYTGPFYQPKTIVGDYARTAGEIVPGALLMPEGSLAANALRYGLLPALSSETAGQLTKGTAAEPWARAFGAILGAAPGAWRDLPWARSAPAIAEPLAPPAFDRVAQLRLNVAAGRAAEAAVGIPANAPKPSIKIPGSTVRRFPDRLTTTRLEEVKNVQYLALTQQIKDYLAYAQANGLIFILHVHPETKYSGPLQDLFNAGQIIPKKIEGLSK
jgi:hypothetical protein